MLSFLLKIFVEVKTSWRERNLVTSKFKTNDVKKAKAIEVNIYGGKLINLGLNINKFLSVYPLFLFDCSCIIMDHNSTDFNCIQIFKVMDSKVQISVHRLIIAFF